MYVHPPQARQPLLDAIQAQTFTDPVSARGQCLQLLQLARDAFDTRIFIATALQLSLIEDQLGDFECAIGALGEALVFAEEFNEMAAKPALLEQLGCCHYSLANYPQALGCWMQCVNLCGVTDALRATRALALIGLGRICDVCGENRLAVKMHSTAHGLLLPSNDYFLITMAEINWAVNLQRLQQWREASMLLNNSLQLSREHVLPHHAAECLFRLAQIAIAERQLDRAEHLISDALMLIVSTPYHWVEINLLSELATLHALRQQPERALENIQRALPIAQNDGLRQLEMQLLAQAHRYALALNRGVTAQEYARQLSFLQLHMNVALPLSSELDLAILDELIPDQSA